MRKYFAPADLGIAGSFGLLVLRLVIGLGMALHGSQKIGHAMSWMGPDSWAPPFLQVISVIAEFGGGLGIFFGLLTPLSALGVALNMTVAMFAVHFPNGDVFVAGPGMQGGSFELPMIYFATAVCIMLIGPGLYSLDALLFKKKTIMPTVIPQKPKVGVP